MQLPQPQRERLPKVPEYKDICFDADKLLTCAAIAEHQEAAAGDAQVSDNE